MGEECKIIGWYHSHPHITVLPSQVDVNTQASYQALDSGFIGLIFSVFDKGRIEICAFQSLENNSSKSWSRVEVPIEVRTHRQGGLESLQALQVSMLNEERATFSSFVVKDTSHRLMGCLNIYSSSIQRIVDCQLLPLLAVAKSRKQSLLAQKQRLLRELAALEAMDSHHNGSNNLSLTGHASHNLLKAMLLASRAWTTIHSALQTALCTGFMVTSVLVTRNRETEVLELSSVPLLLCILPTQMGLWIQTKHRPPVISPWHVIINGVVYYILSIWGDEKSLQLRLETKSWSGGASEDVSLTLTLDRGESTTGILSLVKEDVLQNALSLHV